ncbi:hypothetical protein [Paenibacillus sp. NPDC058071]|uniref:hypothetical protein n=1 Tax=Paenibacillus sp. NPDC058071 TaxID=3346326 RepID=UPI0036DE0877
MRIDRAAKKRKSSITINYITIYNNIYIIQKATSGGQINRNGSNANQGRQIAWKKGKNIQSGSR